jgi:hypothetical protein
MPTTGIYTDSIRLRGKSDDSKQTGLTVALLPEGGTAPGDLISLTQNAGTNWQYDFSGAVTNGRYTLYINGSPAQNGGVDIELYVMRNEVSAGDTDFAY